MRKLLPILLVVVLVGVLAGGSAAEGPQLQGNPSGAASITRGTAPAPEALLWDNGAPDDVDGLASELGTMVSDARSADDFILDDGCELYDITHITGWLAQNSNPLVGTVEIYPDSGGAGPLDPPIASFPALEYLYYGFMWGWIDAWEVHFDTPGLQLPPGKYWVSVIGNGDGSLGDRAFFMTTNFGAPQLQEGHFKSNYFGFPSWVPVSTVIWLSDFAFNVQGECAGAETKMFVRQIQSRYLDYGGRYKVQAKVRIWDEFNVPVTGAVVDVMWTYPDGTTVYQSGGTSPAGVAKFQGLSLLSGNHEICVLNVTAPGYFYDPGMNWETCETVTIP